MVLDKLKRSRKNKDIRQSANFLSHLNNEQLVLILLTPLTMILSHFIQLWLPTSPLLKYLFTNINKKNFINLIFVKKGWFWSSLIGWWNIFIREPLDLEFRDITDQDQNNNSNSNKNNNSSNHKNKTTPQDQPSLFKRFTNTPLKRFGLLIAAWYICTQSMILHRGSLIDLIFVSTGGKCQPPAFVPDFISSFDNNNKNYSADSKIHENTWETELNKWIKRGFKHLKKQTGKTSTWEILQYIIDNKTSFFTKEFSLLINKEHAKFNSIQCRKIGGQWIGGYDISGHIFLLNLMIWWLLGEHFLYCKAKRQQQQRRQRRQQINQGANSLTTQLNSLKTLASNAHNCTEWTEKKQLIKTLLTKTVHMVTIDQSWIMVYFLVFLWWYNFLVTCVGFHTFGEKYWALLVSYIVAYKIYI